MTDDRKELEAALSAQDALVARIARMHERAMNLEGLIHSVRDKLKFEANSPGGIVASIDAVIYGESTVEQDALGGKPSQKALSVFTTFEQWWEWHCGPIGLIPTKRTPEKRHAQQAWKAAMEACARLVDDFNEQSETGDTLTMLAANIREGL